MTAWIQILSEEDATGDLAEAYASIKRKRGKLSNIMRVHSLRPAAMTSHMQLYLDLMFSRSGLSRADRELIATVVSAANGCPYCVHHHAAALDAYWKDRERVDAAVRDFRDAGLTDREVAMLEYATSLTRTPGDSEEAHVERLREAGFSDADILDINLVTAYFNFANRITSGLGVTFSEDEASGYKY
jgi:uncharacterized peroxidase-related enzyme